MAEYHIPSDNMESRIIQMDRGRANYYNYYTGHTWGEMRRYDLTLNSSITGINGAVEMIAQLVRLRSAQLDQALPRRLRRLKGVPMCDAVSLPAS